MPSKRSKKEKIEKSIIDDSQADESDQEDRNYQNPEEEEDDDETMDEEEEVDGQTHDDLPETQEEGEQSGTDGKKKRRKPRKKDHFEYITEAGMRKLLLHLIKQNLPDPQKHFDISDEEEAKNVENGRPTKYQFSRGLIKTMKKVLDEYLEQLVLSANNLCSQNMRQILKAEDLFMAYHLQQESLNYYKQFNRNKPTLITKKTFDKYKQDKQGRVSVKQILLKKQIIKPRKKRPSKKNISVEN